jgi:hypothetical protein
MKSMEKLEVLREAGMDPKVAEAVVRIQEESSYITKDYLDAKLNEMSSEIRGEVRTLVAETRTQILLAVLGAAGLILGSIYFVLPRLIVAP